MKSFAPAFVLLAAIAGTSFAQTRTPQYALDANGEYVDPHGIWRWAFRSMDIPINLSYEEMTPAQRARVRAEYPGMPAADEPPFPKDGLETLIRVVLKVQRQATARGRLQLLADIGADGVPTSVRILKTPNQGLARIVAEAILLTPFKPGKCSGRPCPMTYPFTFDLGINRYEGR